MADDPPPRSRRYHLAARSLTAIFGLAALLVLTVSLQYPRGLPPEDGRYWDGGVGLFLAVLGLHYVVFAAEDAPILRDLGYLLSLGRRRGFLYPPWLLRLLGVTLLLAGLALAVHNLRPVPH